MREEIGMKYEDMEYITPKLGILYQMHIYLIDGRVYECLREADRENYCLKDLETGKTEQMNKAYLFVTNDQIHDITYSYVKEYPDYAMERMETARQYLRNMENFTEAFHLLEPMASNDDPEAQYLTAACFYKAPNHIWQPEIVNEYLEKAARQGHMKAQYFLAENYRTGFNNIENPVLSAKWYEKAAMQGHARAAAFTGLNYECGVEGLYPADEKAAFHWYQISAEANEPLGIYYLGLAYENGVGTKADRKKAMEYYRKGAEMNHKKCAFRYAYIQDPVYGFKEFYNADAALKWYFKARYLRDERASRYLGLHYANGTCGLDVNHRKAQEMFIDGASLGDAPCAAEAGRAYLYGHNGVKQDLHQAFLLCSQAAEAGDVIGMLLMSHYYLLIPGTKENLEKSLSWGKKAKALGGDADVLLEEAQKRMEAFRKEEKQVVKKKKGLFGWKQK